MLHILYLVHDVSDPAVRRRVAMLRTGGAKVTVGGFRRSDEPPADIDGIRPIDLGRTHDGKFVRRLGAVAKAATAVAGLLKQIERPDLILARNLEMLALARRVKSVMQASHLPVVYECLDIHRLMVRGDAIGSAMRAAERYFSRDVGLLVTSSPAFVSEYFVPFRQFAKPIEILENKYLELGGTPQRRDPSPSDEAGPPWRIGWFGALRCRRSLDLLATFTQRYGGDVEIVLRGRPALSELPDFHAFVDAQPYMSFLGPYRNPEDMASIYGEVHFSWAIDFFEEGLNSKWLLPNRLYEGGRFGAVPISMAETATSRFLESHGIGLQLVEPTVPALETLFDGIDAERYRSLKAQMRSRDMDTWRYAGKDCERFVDRLRSLTATPDFHPA